eukprot:8679118-Pyramimonas_sp.AAC.1
MEKFPSLALMCGVDVVRSPSRVELGDMCEAALAPMRLWDEQDEGGSERMRGIAAPHRLSLTTLSAELHLCAMAVAATFTRETHKQAPAHLALFGYVQRQRERERDCV